MIVLNNYLFLISENSDFSRRAVLVNISSDITFRKRSIFQSHFFEMSRDYYKVHRKM